MLNDATNTFGLAHSEQRLVEITQRLEEFRDEVLLYKNENTRRAYLSDFSLYKSFCDSQGLHTLSSDKNISKKTIKTYVKYLIEKGYKKDTVKRKLSSISYFIDIAELYNPIRNSKVFKEFVKTLINSKKHRTIKKQATAFKLEHLDKFNSMPTDTLLDIRNAAIINLAFDSMLRASNIIDLDISDIYEQENNVVFVKFSKTDQSGEGSYRYISDFTRSAIDAWVQKSGITTGKLFRRIRKGGKVSGDGLSYSGLLLIVKGIGERVGIEITCHSSRVGAAVSMYELNMRESEIMRHGHWKSAGMVARYTEKARLKTGGMAEVRKKAGAD